MRKLATRHLRFTLAPAAAVLFYLLIGPTVGVADDHDDPDLRTALKAIEIYQQEDWDRLVTLFAEDGALHSMMRTPFVGREVISARLAQFHANTGPVTIEVKHIGKVDDVVITERLDVWTMNGIRRQLPAVGVFQFEDGQIKEWREYYDLQSMTARMDPDFEGDPE